MNKSKRAGGKSRSAADPECDLCDHFKCSNAKDCFEGRRDAVQQYRSDLESLAVARAAAEVEAEGYGRATRVEEILHFAKKINAKHIGVAFCTGLKEEARTFCDLMRRKFKVTSVCCKNSAVPKSTFSMPHVRKVKRESMCNPVGQAEHLNRAGTDLNVVLGLCVGHDSLLFKYSDAPVTVLVAKDRVLAHNPVGALYSPYLRRMLEEEVFKK